MDKYLSDFIINARSKDEEEYEPSTLRGMIGSVERPLKRHGYGYHIMSTSCMECTTTRVALKAKQKNLKAKGRGSKTERADPLQENDERLTKTRTGEVHRPDHVPLACTCTRTQKIGIDVQFLCTHFMKQRGQKGIRGQTIHFTMQRSPTTSTLKRMEPSILNVRLEKTNLTV